MVAFSLPQLPPPILPENSSATVWRRGPAFMKSYTDGRFTRTREFEFPLVLAATARQQWTIMANNFRE